MDHGLEVTRGRLNVISKEQLHEIVSGVLADISEVVGGTLGPFGANTLVTEPYATAPIIPSKDGFRLMLNMQYDNILYDSIYRIVRDIAVRMNTEVGDGTTSGLAIANEFYKRIYDFVEKNPIITPYGVRTLLLHIEGAVKKYLKANGFIVPMKTFDKKKRTELYKRIAAVAANNDTEIGDMVASIYSKSHSADTFINVERSETEETIIADDLGFEFPSGFIHRSMATEADGQTAIYRDPYFLLIDGPLTDADLEPLKSFVQIICIEGRKNLVLVASEYTQGIVNFLIQSRIGFTVPMKDGKEELIRLPIMALMVSSASEIGNARIRDMEVVLGATALPTKDGKLINPPADPLSVMRMLGRAKKIKSVPFYCRIFGGASKPVEMRERVKSLQAELEKYQENDPMSTQERAAMLKKRIAMLSSQMTSIKVGGATFKEREWRKLIFEDAVYAVRSAIAHGITLGGNVSVQACIRAHSEEIIAEVLAALKAQPNNVTLNNDENDIRSLISSILTLIGDSFLFAYRRVLSNAFSRNHADKIESILTEIKTHSRAVVYNLMEGEYQYLEDESLIVPGNTDLELMHSVFSVVSLFMTSDQLMSLHMPKK